MKIILAPDSFKGTFSSMEVIEHLERGIQRYLPEVEIVRMPIADGGEGTVEAMVASIGGVLYEKVVSGPLGTPVSSQFAMKGELAIIEMAAASGITLTSDANRNPMVTTSYGTGELILEALNLGAKEILLGIGGSASNDGGIGMLQALGVKLLRDDGQSVGFGGQELSKIHKILIDQLDPRLKDVTITVMCDVTNPLTGPKGATYTYGPQKGGTPVQLDDLENGMIHYESLLLRDFGVAVSEIPGSGAAGGLGAALVVFLSATLRPGIEVILDLVGFDQMVKDADLVITGEGRIDGQSIYGKVPVGIGKRCLHQKAKVIVLAGAVGQEADLVYDYGIDAVFPTIDRPMSYDEVLANPSRLLDAAVDRLFRIIRLGIDIGGGEA
jgi:glycerate kinase